MSKQDKVLAHLKKGNTITGLEAIRLFGLYRLSSAIHQLREKGYNIHTEMVQENGEEYGRYSLLS